MEKPLDELQNLKVKLTCLRRKASEHYEEATVREAIDVLIQCCEFVLNSMVEQVSDEA